MRQVRAYYQTADPTSPASIRFEHEVDGKELILAGGRVSIAITLQDAAGRSVTRQFEVRR
jgi:hypothetical protein